MRQMNISVVILSYNSSATIGATIESAMRVSDDVHVVDSFSSDDTRQIIERSGARLELHPFVNYAAQRNWASANLPLRHDWELHLDADERLSDELITELCRLQAQNLPLGISGYHVARLVRFLNRPIFHGGMFPIWHLRLFHRGRGRCEAREYDQHFVVNGATSRLQGPIIDDIKMSLSEWVIRHNRWSDAEVREVLRADATAAREIVPRLFGSPIERKRYFRSLYYRSPLLMRAFALFVYRYVLRGGFLDGKAGAIFFTLQAFSYRFLVDAKLYECSLANRSAEGRALTSMPRSATSTAFETAAGDQSVGANGVDESW
jgi:glycosyltransferase involved in cell wall biosynthesis